jgi:hypothetical protein
MSNADESPHADQPSRLIVIDGKQFEWSYQFITAQEIKALAAIPADRELFLKLSPPWKDEPILPDARVDLARPGIELFFSREKYVVIINGREKPWYEKEISFEQLVILAFGVASNPNTTFTVGYKNGPEKNREGSMTKGDRVYVKNKMIFNVTATDKS